ncbi:MAG: hypothetical protein Q4F41_20175 [Eubacteriales bacterium]|nr:hypothetical protein [Eubacteriales bacterium]
MCHTHNVYDDGNIPEIDLPTPSDTTLPVPEEFPASAPPHQETERPQKDGPDTE